MAARLNLVKARAMGFSDEEIQAYLASRPDVSVDGMETGVQEPQQDFISQAADWLPVAGGVAGSFIPGIGTIAGGALGAGAGTLAKQLIQQKPVDIGEIGKETAMGAAGGVIGKVASPVLKGAGRILGQGADEGASGILTRAGQTMQKSVAQPKVNPSATAFGEEMELMTAKKNLGIVGDAETQRMLSNKKYFTLKRSIDDQLKINNPTVNPVMSKARVKQAIQGSLNYDKKSPLWDRALNLRLSQVAEKKNVQELLKYKFELGDKLGRAFKKLDIGNDLTPQEEAAMATWQAIDDIIGGNEMLSIAGVAPELKQATKAMSVLHKLAPGLKSSATKGVQLPVVGKVPGITPVAQTGVDAAGRAIEAAGEGLSKVNPLYGTIAGRTASQVAPRAFADQEGTPKSSTGKGSATGGFIPEGSALEDFSGETGKKQQIKQAFVAAMLENPSKASQLKAIYEFGYGGMDGGAGPNVGKTTAKDYGLAKSGLKNVAEVRKLYEEDPEALTKQLVPGQFFSRKFDSALYDAADTLLRLRTGAQANPEEIRGYMKKIGPTFGDSPDVVAYKLAKLESDLAYYLQGGTGSSTLQDFDVATGE